MNVTPHRAVSDALVLISKHASHAVAQILRLYPLGATVEYRVRVVAGGEGDRWRTGTVAGAYVSLHSDDIARAKVVLRIKGRGKAERTASYELTRLRHIARETIAS